MNRILLISPPWYRLLGGSSDSSPLGLCYIAGVLEQHGYDVSIYNADYKPRLLYPSAFEMNARYDEYLHILKDANHPIWKEVSAVISKESPDLVGISVMSAKYASALNVSKLVKNFCPDIPVIWGGVHSTLLPDEVIKNENVDIVVRGEGEYTFLQLVENLKSLEGVLGITYKSNGKIIHNQDRPLIEKLDELPFPARHLILGKENYHPNAFGNIFATRGCPYNCIFCASHKVWTKKVRRISPERVVEEIKEIKRIFKTSRFRFEDDSFTLNKKYVESICELLVKENLGIKWTTETRADLVSYELIRKMKSAGCEAISIGVESGDEETLKRIKKGVTIEQIRDASIILKENKMRFCAFFMIGFPWETKKHINKTVSLMKELNPHEAVFSVATPYPSTELYDICASDGLLPEKIDWSTFFHQSPNVHFSKNFTREELSQIVKQTAKIFEEHNKKEWRKMLVLDPLYAIGRVVEANYYDPRDLWTLFRRLVWK